MKLCLLLVVCFATSSWAFFGQPHRRNDEPSLLQTMSLSINGDFGLNKFISAGKKIISGLFELIDLKAVRVAVNWVFDTLMPNAGKEQVLTSRQDLIGPDYTILDLEQEQKLSNEKIRSGVTMIIGGLMQKQDCWARSACIVGKNARGHPLAKFATSMAHKLLPSWNQTITAVGQAIDDPKLDCNKYQCNEQIDGRKFRGNV